MTLTKYSYRIPHEFYKLISVMSEIEFHHSVLDGLIAEPGKLLDTVRADAIKTLEHGLLTIYEEADYISMNTTNQLLIKDGKLSEINRSYLKCIETAFDLLNHIISWDDWYRSAMEQNRKAGITDKFAANNIIYKKITTDLEEILGRNLIGTDYPVWVQNLRDNYPVPPVITTTRNSKKKSNIPDNPIPDAATVERETAWVESSTRKKFEELTGHKPTKKRKNHNLSDE
jgi:hypothetical protein